jgi:hypothetical protein
MSPTDTNPVTANAAGGMRFKIKYVRLCVCGADSLKDMWAEEAICPSCWLHMRDQETADAVLGGAA